MKNRLASWKHCQKVFAVPRFPPHKDRSWPHPWVGLVALSHYLSALYLSFLTYKKMIVINTPMRVVVRLVIGVNTCIVLSTGLDTD